MSAKIAQKSNIYVYSCIITAMATHQKATSSGRSAYLTNSKERDGGGERVESDRDEGQGVYPRGIWLGHLQ